MADWDDIEMRLRLYYEHTKDYLEVADDADGLGLIELRNCDENGKIHARIVVSSEHAAKLIIMLQKMILWNVERDNIPVIDEQVRAEERNRIAAWLEGGAGEKESHWNEVYAQKLRKRDGV